MSVAVEAGFPQADVLELIVRRRVRLGPVWRCERNEAAEAAEEDEAAGDEEVLGEIRIADLHYFYCHWLRYLFWFYFLILFNFVLSMIN